MGWNGMSCLVICVIFVSFVDQVLDAGEVIEYEMPYILLQSSDGLFTKLVTQTGKHMTIRLKQMAKQYYSHKTGHHLEL